MHGVRHSIRHLCEHYNMLAHSANHHSQNTWYSPMQAGVSSLIDHIFAHELLDVLSAGPLNSLGRRIQPIICAALADRIPVHQTARYNQFAVRPPGLDLNVVVVVNDDPVIGTFRVTPVATKRAQAILDLIRQEIAHGTGKSGPQGPQGRISDLTWTWAKMATGMRVNTPISVHVWACVSVRERKRVHVDGWADKQAGPHMRACVRACVPACLPACLHACVRARVLACVPCHAMPCRAVPCRAVPCRAVPWHAYAVRCPQCP